MKTTSMLILGLALASFAAPSSAIAQQFTQSYSTPIDIGGFPKRYAPSATNFNGSYYVAYTDQSGYVYIAVGAGGSQYVSPGTQVSTPTGLVTSFWNPAILASNGYLYLSYVVSNTTAYLTSSTNGTTWTTPVAVALPSGSITDSPALGTVIISSM